MKSAKSFNSFNNQCYKNSKIYSNCTQRLKIMASLVDQNQKILDLGCGTGEFIKILQHKNPQTEGLEISKKVAKIAQKNGLKIKIADLNKTFPYKRNSFDTITAGELIEHIYDTDFFLEEIKRVLKNNGTFILSTPNLATLGRRLMLLLGINPLIETSLENASGHIRYFTKKSLEELLAKHNFKIIYFCSDTINFSNNGRFQNEIMARLFPTLGARIIIKAINLK
jgi:2-polyprenyl-3-methyl-5-hydroxy-6-metoxy-1,4-benzoquinol methylase